jgi:hypothetical protein
MRPALLLLLASVQLSAGTIDFEDQADGTILTNQYPGMTFTNATVLTVGIGLNEFDFPPRSGLNVIFDDGGPITLVFASPVLSFTGHFTYLAPVTLYAYDAGHTLLATATSQYSNNLGLSGEPGSRPNEPLALAFATGIARIEIRGQAAGSSLTLDDVVTNTVETSIPEPGTLILSLASLALLTYRNTIISFCRDPARVSRNYLAHCILFSASLRAGDRLIETFKSFMSSVAV